jgi:predicted nucleic acid-binding protein
MKYVFDASTGAKCVLPEAHSDKAIRLRDAYRQGVHQLLSPDFYPVGVTRAERQGRITPAQGAVGLRDTLNHLPLLQPSLTLLPRAYALSSAVRLGVYDCVYSRPGRAGRL